MSRLFIILLTVNNQDIAAVQLLLASDRPHKEPRPRLNRSTLCKLLWSCWRPFVTEDDRRSCSMKLLINSPCCFSSAGLMSVGAGECWNANGCFYVRVRLRLCIVLGVDTRHVGAKQFVHWLGLKKNNSNQNVVCECVALLLMEAFICPFFKIGNQGFWKRKPHKSGGCWLWY